MMRPEDELGKTRQARSHLVALIGMIESYPEGNHIGETLKGLDLARMKQVLEKIDEDIEDIEQRHHWGRHGR